MSRNKHEHKLLKELISNPADFFDRGKSADLLEAYFNGLPQETLRPLFKNKETIVKRTAIYLAAELGASAGPLIDAVADLRSVDDKYVRYYLMDYLIVNAHGAHAHLLDMIMRELHGHDVDLRERAIILLSRATMQQLSDALASLSGNFDSQGLRMVTEEDTLTAIGALERNESLLSMSYAAILALRMGPSSPALWRVVEDCSDVAIRNAVRFVAADRTRGTQGR